MFRISKASRALKDRWLSTSFLLVLVCVGAASAQTTSFTYQGRLQDGGTSANGSYDFQFTLWDALSGGTQQPQPGPVAVTRTAVAVTNGIFTVQLDFGANAFPGANRFLEIGARLTGAGSFTTLSPRQQISSTPYAIRSLNASSADNVLASGTLSASVINTTTQYNLDGSRVLGLGPNTGSNNLLVGLNAGNALIDGRENTFIGTGAGQATTGGPLDCADCGPGGTPLYKGSHNTFLGYRAGLNNTSGAWNSFFGASAGASSTTANNTSFFGSFAGVRNTAGSNSFFGSFAGYNNTTGSNNAYFGNNAGISNTVGSQNSVFGSFAGGQNGNENSFFGSGAGTQSTGSGNSFFGSQAGTASAQGNNNTIIGARADLGSSNLTNAAAIGAFARVDQSNSMVLGSINGVNSANTDTNVGIGTTTPQTRLQVRTNTGIYGITHTDGAITVGSYVGGGSSGAFGGWLGTQSNHKLFFFTGNGQPTMTVDTTGNVGIGTFSPDRTLTVNGTADKPGGGSWDVFSDERLKTFKGRFTPGLKAVMQLQPVRYEYKPDNALSLKSKGEHIGFGAQAMQKIIPEAVSKNDKGYLLINNDPIMWAMLNAIKEQQQQIEQQRQQIIGLKKLVCRSRRHAPVCK